MLQNCQGSEGLRQTKTKQAKQRKILQVGGLKLWICSTLQTKCGGGADNILQVLGYWQSKLFWYQFKNYQRMALKHFFFFLFVK